jgi:hypothetical protein
MRTWMRREAKVDGEDMRCVNPNWFVSLVGIQYIQVDGGMSTPPPVATAASHGRGTMAAFCA